MRKLSLLQHPLAIRSATDRKKKYPVDWEVFLGILRDFSQLKMNGELGRSDSDDFKKDLLRNDPETVVVFIEKSIEVPSLHPVIHLILFDVLKKFTARGEIASTRRLALCEKLLKERGDDISKRYDIQKVKADLLAAA